MVLNTEAAAGVPEWRSRPVEHDLSIGIEEEAMLVDPETGEIAHRSDEVVPRLRERIGDHFSVETHDSAFELASGVHRSVAEAVRELGRLRREAAAELPQLGVLPAVAGTHPTAVWPQIEISSEQRYERIHDAMRELARREPTFALHLHVGIGDPDRAIEAFDRMRVHLPLLLALSANSPFWQGRDSGLASARIPLFQAFPRVGVPRAFGDWSGYRDAVAPLLASEAISELSFLWWDIRPQAELGTIELRIMDAQTRLEDTAALVAFARALVALELEAGHATPRAMGAQEVIEENRFRAARDGIDAELIDADAGALLSVQEVVSELLDRCREHAQELDCSAELDEVRRLLAGTGAARQRRIAGDPPQLRRLIQSLTDSYWPD